MQLTKQEIKDSEKYYKQLVGKRVNQVLFNGTDEFGLEFTDGTIAWILCDWEGNGPGHLEITKAKKAV